MKTTHTPGPWVVRTPDHFVDGLAHMIVSEHPQEGYWHIAEMGTHNGREVPAANARLIASAPELLDALRFALLHIEHRDGLKHRKDLFTDDERDYLRAAIAKAEGGGQ